MKILHCISQMPDKTGSGVYFKNIIMHMEKKGYENCAIFAVENPFKVEFPKSVKTFPVEFSSSRLNFPIPGMSDVMPYPSTKYSSMTEEMKDRWKEAFKEALLKAKKDFDPDVVITHHLFMLSSMVREVFFDKKIISLCHGTDIRQVVRHREKFEKDVKRICDIDVFLSVSSRDVENIKNIFCADEKKIHVIGAGFDQKIFFEGERKTKKDKIDIVFAGKISREKGTFELFKAIEKVQKIYPDICFHLIGNIQKDEKSKVEFLAKNIKDIKFKSALSQKDFASCLRNSDIFVLPSYFESLGLVAIEALACGNYVVSTKIQGLFDFLGDEINSSGVIKYVDLPRLKDLDLPFEEYVDIFVDNLSKSIIDQIEKIKSGKTPDEKIKESIKKLSWEKILDKIENFCLK